MGHGHRLLGVYFIIVLRMHVLQYLCPQFVSEMFGMFTVSMQIGQSMDSGGSAACVSKRLFMKLYLWTTACTGRLRACMCAMYLAVVICRNLIQRVSAS
jgi:hypothetical protein